MRGKERQPRDDLGRFASKKLSAKRSSTKISSAKRQPRDDLGRFVEKKWPPTKKLPAKRPPAKESSAKRPPTKRLPAKRLPAKRLPAKRLPAKKLPAKKLPAKKLPAKKLPAKKLPAKKPPAKKLPAKKLPAKRPSPKKRKKPERPLLPERSRQAEVLMQEKLIALFDGIAAEGLDLVMAVQTFVNSDGTVDGELRIENLPDGWREPGAHILIVEFLSHVFRYFDVFPARPPMGGSFWASFGIRFGPQNEAEIGELENLYKRYRGLFQIGTYPTQAWSVGALQNVLVDYKVGLRSMLENLMAKRGLPPTVILVRFIWVPDDKRPAHYMGEKGEK